MKDILIKSYNRDALNYEEKFREFQENKYSILFNPKHIHVTKQKPRLLDIGCGTGLFKDFLEKNNYNISYHGVDLAEEMVNIAKEKTENIIWSDIINTPFLNNSFDCAVCFTVLRIINDDEINILKEIKRILKPNGVLYLSVLKHKVDDTLYTHLKEAGFNIVNEKPCGQDIGFICNKEETKIG